MKVKGKDNLVNLLQVKNFTETSADLYFYGDIVSSWWGAWDDTDQYPSSVRDFLNEAKGKNLNIYINSGGGAVFAGMAIYNMLKRHEGYKTVYVDGVAASIASVIALAGDKIIIPANAYFMIHKPWTMAIGNANELRDMADTLDTVEEGILNVYKEHLVNGIDIETIKEMMDQETWMTGEEAAKYFNIEVGQAIEAVAYSGEMLDKFQNAPQQLKRQLKNAKEQSLAAYQARLNFLKLKGGMIDE
ncbi:head maturation protease, ClpP-related [Anoxybacillus flavithermus]|uniref:head maturation protease, ClpP-related n=1 Tax=Anoxybacillus flavithermus TaxID=33934 RepID=UPI00186881C1|nr:head maturation protease, ClpP-related [Anoxybacillus flavithermus]MBE2905399.1 Clp protease ClpP [Anoxybacillus flavithermus]